ncbi:MAG TPA: GatB/YqeY domain-containing protein [Candidatus Dormibacteraeota bacterium]|nr:GatB/YqeY domain-containing protein [Candidatus Dormibacteraeota bacterium]
MGLLKDRFASDLREAMKARDQLRADTLRSAISGFTYKRGETGREPTDAEELDVVRRLVKQRADSIEEFEKAGRTELAQKERAEREVLLAYLPQQKSADEVRAIVATAMATLPAGERNQGAVMKAVMPQLRGLADGKLVAEIVQEALKARESK